MMRAGSWGQPGLAWLFAGDHASDLAALEALLVSGTSTPGSAGGGQQLSKSLKALLLSPGAEAVRGRAKVAASRDSLRRLSQLSELSQIVALREQLAALHHRDSQ